MIDKLMGDLADNEIEKELWERWLSLYPEMVLGRLKLIEFEEFKGIVMKKGSFKMLTVEEIYLDAESIIDEFNSLKKGGE